VLGYVLFGVVIKGSILLLFLVTVLFLVGGLGMGLLISTAVESQQLAFMIAIIVTMLPTFILSGFVFPIRNMPLAVQAITYVIPARYFLVALRAIILKGAGLSAFWDQVLFLALFALLMLGISSMRLRRILP
jgi:ABC-2 type transport system permease protein